MSQDRVTGGCQCGSVRYVVTGRRFQLNVCHCRDCQTQSGSAFGMSLVIEPEGFQLLSGLLKEFVLTADSGREKTCAFCPECGVRIYNRTSALMSVNAGTLDDTTSLVPTGHYWTKRRQGWIQLPDDLPTFDTI